jgi:3-hydroxyacyl-CoA dehydrogenase
MEINNVVVIGSGTMGSGIAAQLCNANIPVTLLDLKTEISQRAKEKILHSRTPRNWKNLSSSKRNYRIIKTKQKNCDNWIIPQSYS